MTQYFLSIHNYIQTFKSYRNQIGWIALGVLILSIIAYKQLSIFYSTATTPIEQQDQSQYSKQVIDKSARSGMDSEEVLAEFKQKRSDHLPEVKHLIIQAMARIQQKLGEFDRQIQSLSEKQLDIQKTTHPGNATDSKVQAIDADLNAIMTSKEKLHQELSNYQRELRAVLQVERRFHQQVHDYDHAVVDDGQDTLKSSDVGNETNLGQESNKGQSVIEESSENRTQAIPPNQIIVFFLGLLLLLGSGIGYRFYKKRVITGINSPNELKKILGVPPLIVIPYLENQDDLIRKVRSKKKNTIIWLILVLLLIVLTYAYQFIMPLRS